MRRKIVMLLLASLMVLIVFSGCSREESVENRFIAAVAAGLEARWAYMDSDEAKVKPEEYYTSKHQEAYIPMVEKELEQIAPFEEEEFKDEVLGELAGRYITACKTQRESLEYMLDDVEKYTEMWSSSREEMNEVIYTLIKDYELTVSEEYAENLKTYVDMFESPEPEENVEDDQKDEEEGKTEEETEESIQSEADTALVREMLESCEFGTKDMKKYKAKFKNTADFGIKSITADVKLIDANGQYMDPVTLKIGEVNPGEKISVSFKTKRSFDGYEIGDFNWEKK